MGSQNNNYGRDRDRDRFIGAGLTQFELNVYMLTTGAGDGNAYDTGIVARRILKEPEIEVIAARNSAMRKLGEL